MDNEHNITPDQIADQRQLFDQSLAKLRQLNDELRTERRGGTVVITSGIAALGPTTVNRVLNAVQKFDSFNCDNDPYGEHDCAVMTVSGIKIIWKIDYYDLTRRFLSSDPTDPNLTARVMTVMRADEY